MVRLIDFNRSTCDLAPHLQLYIEANGIHPVSALQLQSQHLYLLTAPKRPLTLDQFRAQTQQVVPTAELFLPGPPPQRLYGYRLVPQRLLLG